MTSFSYRRPAVINRPWLTGKVYDDYVRPTVLHLDAYVLGDALKRSLVVEARRGGRTLVACDAYMIEPGALTPLWDTDWRSWGAVPLYYGNDGVPWARLHATLIHVIAPAYAALGADEGGWSRVVVQAHYVPTVERDPFPYPNAYKARDAANP